MDPAVITLLSIACFVVGIAIGWAWRGLMIKEKIQQGVFEQDLYPEGEE